MISDVKVVDNFYSNPDDIVKLLSNDYPIFGCGNGKRSVGLQELSPQLYMDFCNTIYNMHGLDNQNLHVFTFFMEHEYNPIEVFNHNWVHIDGKNPNVCRMTTEDYRLVMCGQIFMTPNPDPESNVEICRVRPEVNWGPQELISKTVDDYTLPREYLNSGKISQEQFEKMHDEYHANFETTCTINNAYNRMVSWRAGTLHGARQTKLMPKRLTQFFFVQSKVPLNKWPGKSDPLVQFYK